MKKFDRFDFEQQIMQCWHVTDDIRTVTEYLLDAPLEDDRQDKIANMLLGIEALYQAKFDKLFLQFEDLISEYCHVLDRNSKAIDEFNKAIDEFNDEQIRNFVKKAEQDYDSSNQQELDLGE